MKTGNVTPFPGTRTEEVGDVWQVRAILIPGWVDDSSTPYRPIGALAVSRRHGLVGGAEDLVKSGPGHRQAEQALASLARVTGARPAAIEVDDPELAERLRKSRRWRECEVRIRETLDDVDRAYAAFREQLGQEHRQPPILDGEDVTLADVRRFGDAAAQLWDAAPWRMFTNLDVALLTTSPPHPELRACCVMGAGGEQYGILLAASPDDFDALSEIAEDRDGPLPPLWSMSFDEPWELPVADHDLWLEHSLPRVDGDRIPTLRRFDPATSTMRSATASELELIIDVMTAVTRTTDQQSARDSWSVQMPRANGSAEVRFDWPPLEAEAVAEMVAGQSAAWGVEHDDPEELDGEALLQDAHTLAALSFDVSGRMAARLAARAIALDPTESLGYQAAASAAIDPTRAVELGRLGVRIARSAIGDDAIEAARGNITDIEGGHGLLGLCHQLADDLAAAGQLDEALAVDDEMLSLDLLDRFGARFLRAAHLLAAARPAEALAWLQECCVEDDSANARYLTALARHLVEGAGPAADRALDEAFKANETVPLLILGIVPIPDGEPPVYAPGSPDEAVLHAHRFGWLWQRWPESVTWMSERFARHVTARKTAARGRGSKPKRRRR